VGALSGGLPIATVAAPPQQGTRPAARRAAPPGVRRKRLLLKVANHSVAIAIALMFMLPLLFVVLTSFMTAQQAGSSELWPHPWVWGNYAKVLDLFPAWTYLRNTIEYAVLSTVGVLLSSVLVAYALSRMEWRGRGVVFLLVLATLMLPSQVTIVPLYVVFVRLHWIGSLKPLIIPAFFGDAFSIFLLRQFFMTIPQEMSDAARVDGAGEFRILWSVIVPLAKPGIAAVGLFQFLYAWNDFFNPLLYAGNNPGTATYAVALTQLQQTQLVHFGVPYNVMMAAALLFTIPVLIIFFFAQKVFIEGVTLTGVKG
jgi:multiple sugar transport system permease protein